MTRCSRYRIYCLIQFSFISGVFYTSCKNRRLHTHIEHILRVYRFNFYETKRVPHNSLSQSILKVYKCHKLKGYPCIQSDNVATSYMKKYPSTSEKLCNEILRTLYRLGSPMTLHFLLNVCSFCVCSATNFFVQTYICI